MLKDWRDMAMDLSEILPEDNESKIADKENADKSVQVKQTINKHVMRRVYHCVSFGDVDALTYLRCIVKQQRIKYALISTLCMASEDIAEIRSWLEKGYIGRCDFYVGEIFKASYYRQYEELIALCKELGGRVAICRNHSKVMVAIGERFDCVVESSANVNTNPRIENAVITVDSDLAHWYKNFFDGIKSFERNFDDVKPMEV